MVAVVAVVPASAGVPAGTAAGTAVGAGLSQVVSAAAADLALAEAERHVLAARRMERAAPAGNLPTARQAGERQGRRAGRAAPGPAGIHRGLSWAPRVTGNWSSRLWPTAVSSGLKPRGSRTSIRTRNPHRPCPAGFRVLLVLCKLGHDAARRHRYAAKVVDGDSGPQVLPCLIVRRVARVTSACGSGDGGWQAGNRRRSKLG